MNTHRFNPKIHTLSCHRLDRNPRGKILHTESQFGLNLALYQGEITNAPEWRILYPENPIPCTSVELERAEGRPEECISVTCNPSTIPGNGIPGHTFEKPRHTGPIEEAQATLYKWGFTAPDDGSYDKCDFTIHWLNGETYSGRFDLQQGGTAEGDVFSTSIKRRILHRSGLCCPPWWKEKYGEEAFDLYTIKIDAWPSFKQWALTALATLDF